MIIVKHTGKQILYHYDVKVGKGENDGSFYPLNFALKYRNKTSLSLVLETAIL